VVSDQDYFSQQELIGQDSHHRGLLVNLKLRMNSQIMRSTVERAQCGLLHDYV
jgi:hypothetical protein